MQLTIEPDPQPGEEKFKEQFKENKIPTAAWTVAIR